MFAAGVAAAHPGQLIAGSAILLLAFSLAHRGVGTQLTGLLRRVRWLLVSLLILYGWFTPGVPALPLLGAYSPTWSGLAEGSARILALVLMVAAVCLLLQVTGREQLLAAVNRLTRPLARLGIPHERLAARMVLTLHAVPEVQDLVRDALRAGRAREGVVNRIAGTTAGAFAAVLDQAERQDAGWISAPAGRPVPRHQWLYPLLMAVLFWLLA
ncbi:MAG: hypothetical protein WCC36_16865 [Gammaproteobacteria bacterium]